MDYELKCRYFNCRELNSEYQGYCSKLCKQYHERIIRTNKIKEKAINYLGGECKRCTFKENIAVLVFHHLDPFDKKYDISRKMSKGFLWNKPELDKCILLCKNCHDIVHLTREVEYFNLNRYSWGTRTETVKCNLGKDKCTLDFLERVNKNSRNTRKLDLIPSELRNR